MLVIALAVQPVGPPEQLQAQVKVLPGLAVLGFGSLDQAAGIGQFAPNAVLPWLEVLDRDGVCQVGVDELLLLPFQLDYSSSLGLQQSKVTCLSPVELLVEDLADLLAQSRSEVDLLPLAQDGQFDGVGW